MYAVLPSHYGTLGITAAQVGWLLSINRLVRLPLNIPSAWLSDHLGYKWPYVGGLALGCLSTVGYGLFPDFVPLLLLRALWGVAWALLVVASYGMIFEVSEQETRGRYTGIYASCSFFGGAAGAALGGVLVDTLGLALTMRILGGCTSLACLVALSLPDLRSQRVARCPGDGRVASGRGAILRAALGQLRGLDHRVWLVVALNFIYRFVFAGLFFATFGLYLSQIVGDALHLGGLTVGVASLTGTLLFVRNVLTVLVAPSAGYLSDRLGRRKHVLLLGEALGIAGLVTLAASHALWPVGLGMLLLACAYGLIPSMLATWMGDLTEASSGRGPAIGSYQTLGDLGSGLGPLVAYPLIAFWGVRLTYGLAASALALTVPLLLWAREGLEGRRS